MPPVQTTATGTAELTYDPATRVLTWNLNYSGLSGPATMAHFHGPADAGKNGPPVIWLSPKGSPVQVPVKGEADTDPRAGAAVFRRRVVHQRPHAGSSGRRNPRPGDAAEELITARRWNTAATAPALRPPRRLRSIRSLRRADFPSPVWMVKRRSFLSRKALIGKMPWHFSLMAHARRLRPRRANSIVGRLLIASNAAVNVCGFFSRSF